MEIIIRSTENQKKELIKKGFGKDVTIKWMNTTDAISGMKADAFFDFSFNDENFLANEFSDQPIVFANAVSCLSKEINKPNYIRLNAWNGFIERDIIELACNNAELKKAAERILNKLEWKFVWVADSYGFIEARIIIMIINEAYYALEDNVSTKQQIDIAMKLGTNYPYGPFEWSQKIGLRKILFLLKQLAKQNSRYTISSLLVQEIQQFN